MCHGRLAGKSRTSQRFGTCSGSFGGRLCYNGPHNEEQHNKWSSGPEHVPKCHNVLLSCHSACCSVTARTPSVKRNQKLFIEISCGVLWSLLVFLLTSRTFAKQEKFMEISSLCSYNTFTVAILKSRFLCDMTHLWVTRKLGSFETFSSFGGMVNSSVIPSRPHLRTLRIRCTTTQEV